MPCLQAHDRLHPALKRLKGGRALAGTAIAAALIFAPAAARAADATVNVYNWSDYVDPEVLRDFTAETGIAVTYDTFDSNDIVETKLLAGGSGYDVVVSSDVYVFREIAAGVLLPLDTLRLPNLRHVWSDVSEALAAYDPGNRFAVNYMWGTTGLGYDIDKVRRLAPDAPTDSWALLFDPENAKALADCGIHVLDSPDDVLPAALAYLGLDPRSQDPDALARAGEAVAAIRPYVRKFDSSGMINALAGGDICLALAYSGDVVQARDRAAESGAASRIGYVVPREGAAIAFDNFVIPADAPHPEAAHAFIDFMLRPDIAARNSNYVKYANGNRDSQPLLDEAVLGDPAIYPGVATMDRLFALPPRERDLQRFINRMWAEVKAGA